MFEQFWTFELVKMLVRLWFNVSQLVFFFMSSGFVSASILKPTDSSGHVVEIEKPHAKASSNDTNNTNNNSKSETKSCLAEKMERRLQPGERSGFSTEECAPGSEVVVTEGFRVKKENYKVLRGLQAAQDSFARPTIDNEDGKLWIACLDILFPFKK